MALCGNKELSKSATQKALGFVTSMAFRMGASEVNAIRFVGGRGCFILIANNDTINEVRHVFRL